MTPTSQGFAEVREVFFKEVTDMNLNIVNEGGLDKLVEVRPGDAQCWPVGSGVVGPVLLPSLVPMALGDPGLRKYVGMKPMWWCRLPCLVWGGMSQPRGCREAVLPC